MNYIAVPSVQELVDHFGLESIDQAEAEIEARLQVAAALARLTQTNIQSAVDWKKTQTHAIVLAADDARVTVYRPPYPYDLSVHVIDPQHVCNFNTLYLGTRPLTDAGIVAPERAEKASSSNDYVWHTQLNGHILRHKTNPIDTGSFYAANNRNTYPWFALGDHGFPRSQIMFLADHRLYLEAYGYVLSRDVLPFVERGRSLFDSITSGTIFARNSLPVAAHTVGHPV